MAVGERLKGLWATITWLAETVGSKDVREAGGGRRISLGCIIVMESLRAQTALVMRGACEKVASRKGHARDWSRSVVGWHMQVPS